MTLNEQKPIFFVARHASFGMAGSIAAICLKVAISLVITRTMGTESFGMYILALTVLTFAETSAPLGMENMVVRFVSQARALDDPARLRGTVFWSCGLTLILATLLSGAFFVGSDYVVRLCFNNPELTPLLKIMALSLPFSAMSIIIMASLQGVMLIHLTFIAQHILVPFFRLVLITTSIVLGFQLQGVIWAYVVAQILGFALCLGFLIRYVPEIRQGGPMKIEVRQMAFFSLPLFFAGIFNRLIGRLDILLIGHFLSTSAVGIYGLALRVVPLIQLPLGAFNTVFAPLISDLHTQGKHKELETQFKMVAKWIFALTFPLFILLTFYSEIILAFFGSAFAAGSTVMIILCAGQMINSATGSSGFILMMTGRPYIGLFNSAFVCLSNFALNLLLIPDFGIIGAALSNAISVTALQILRVVEVKSILGFHPYRPDFLKPLLSGLLALSALLLIEFGQETKSGIIMLMVNSSLFVGCYIACLFILGNSQEDQSVLKAIKSRFYGRKKIVPGAVPISGNL